MGNDSSLPTGATVAHNLVMAVLAPVIMWVVGGRSGHRYQLLGIGLLFTVWFAALAYRQYKSNPWRAKR